MTAMFECPHGFSIWEASDAHLAQPLVQQLDREIFPEDEAISPFDLEESTWFVLSKETLLCVYAACDKRTAVQRYVGFGGVRKLTYENSAILTRAGVAEDVRGRGLHRVLIQARIDWAKSRQLDSIITYTSVDNHASSNNLIDLGFKLYNPAHPWVGEGFLYWIRSL